MAIQSFYHPMRYDMIPFFSYLISLHFSLSPWDFTDLFSIHQCWKKRTMSKNHHFQILSRKTSRKHFKPSESLSSSEHEPKIHMRRFGFKVQWAGLKQTKDIEENSVSNFTLATTPQNWGTISMGIHVCCVNEPGDRVDVPIPH